jgi:hypothetical protein
MKFTNYLRCTRTSRSGRSSALFAVMRRASQRTFSEPAEAFGAELVLPAESPYAPADQGVARSAEENI